MRLPALYAILNVSSHEDPLAALRRLLVARADLVQLRAKNLTRSEFYSFAAEALALREQFCTEGGVRTKVIVNDDVELARMLSADGVHLGQEDMPPEKARDLLGGSFIIGLSTHTLEQLAAAQTQPVDYLGFGPVFASRTKSGHAETVGIDLLRQAVETSRIPLVAIGGIDAKNAAAVFSAGASSAAVIAALEQSNNPRELIETFEQLRQRQKQA